MLFTRKELIAFLLTHLLDKFLYQLLINIKSLPGIPAKLNIPIYSVAPGTEPKPDKYLQLAAMLDQGKLGRICYRWERCRSCNIFLLLFLKVIGGNVQYFAL